MAMKNIELKLPLPAVKQLAHKLRSYVGVMLFVLFAAVYAYVVVQINTLSNPPVDSGAVTAASKALPVPRIDDNAINQLLSLKDNSVNVQVLFEQGRTNPFQE
jgi:hypothetical protein